MKLGGSDFHGRGGHSESNLGSVSLPIVAVHEFLKLARPIWCRAIKENLENYIKDPSESNLELTLRFGKTKVPKGLSHSVNGCEMIQHYLPSWLSKEEIHNGAFDGIKSKISQILVDEKGLVDPSRSQ